MDENIDLFTKIFLDTDADKGMVIEIVSKIVYGTISGSNVSTEHADIFIFNNGDFDEDRGNLGNDEFLYYKYYLEIEPAEDVENNTFIVAVSNLLISLRDAGYKAIASCDFEELLPRKGGYNFEERQ